MLNNIRVPESGRHATAVAPFSAPSASDGPTPSFLQRHVSELQERLLDAQQRDESSLPEADEEEHKRQGRASQS
jgi:hypothetical protein